MMPGRDQAELIGLMYDAGMGEASWDEVGARLARYLEGHTFNLYTVDQTDRYVDLITTHNFSREFLQTYADHFVQHDIWITEIVHNRLFNRPILGSAVVPDDTFRRSIIYNEFLRPASDTFHIVAALQLLRGGEILTVSAHRSSDAEPFENRHEVALAAFLPHLTRAIELRQRFGDNGRAGVAEVALDRLTHGVVQVARNGSILYANAEAERIMRENDGLSCRPTGLHAWSRSDEARLQYLIHSATQVSDGYMANAAGGHASISRPSGRRPYKCLVVACGHERKQLSSRRAAALLFLTDPEVCGPIDPRALQDLFQLTTAEARIAAALAMGETLPDAAARLGISHNTARALLARANGKVGTNSQLGLVRAILTAVQPVKR